MTILDKDGCECLVFVFPENATCRAADKSPAEITDCPLCKFDALGSIWSDCDEYDEE